MTELKPCPFCGGEAEFQSTVYQGELGNVHCKKCYSSTGGDLQIKNQAETAWNTRPQSLTEKVKWLKRRKHDNNYCQWASSGQCSCGAEGYNEAIDDYEQSLNQASQEVGLNEVYKCIPEELSGHHILYGSKMEIAKAIREKYILVRKNQ